MPSTTTSRSTARAGKFQAGDSLATDPTVAALVAGVTTTADCDAARPILERRHEAAAEALAAHGEPDELAEDSEIAAHIAEADRLRREVDRCRAGLERLATRHAELALADQQAAARAKLAAARKAAGRAEELAASLIPAAAEELRALFDELRTATTAVVDADAAARAAGIGDEAADLLLPHERRRRREIVEDREVLVPAPRGPGVYNAAGQRLGDTLDRGGHRITRVLAEPAPEMIRKIERVIVQHRHAPAAMHRVRVAVPLVNGGEFVVNEGEH